MKRLLLLLAVSVLVVVGCAPVETRYIEILEPDKVWYGGEIDFRVEPGDTLKVIWSQTCRGGRGTCLEVWDMKKGKSGMVKESRMQERHRIYTEEE